MGLPATLAKEVPKVIFNLLSEDDKDQTNEKPHLHDTAIDIFVSEASVLPAYLALLSEELASTSLASWLMVDDHNLLL